MCLLSKVDMGQIHVYVFTSVIVALKSEQAIVFSLPDSVALPRELPG